MLEEQLLIKLLIVTIRSESSDELKCGKLKLDDYKNTTQRID